MVMADGTMRFLKAALTFASYTYFLIIAQVGSFPLYAISKTQLDKSKLLIQPTILGLQKTDSLSDKPETAKVTASLHAIQQSFI